MTLSARLFNWVTSHQRELAYAGVVVAGFVVLYMAGYLYYGHVTKEAQARYNAAYRAMTASMKPDSDSKQWQKTKSLFMEVVNKYSLSKVSRLALPQAAYAAYHEKKYDEAIRLYEQFLSKIGEEADYRGLTQIALAACYEAKGDYPRSIQSLEPLSQERANPYRELAMISLARVYRLSDRPNDCTRVLKQFVKDFPNSPFHPLAKCLLASYNAL